MSEDLHTSFITADCVDKNDNCSYWARVGYCKGEHEDYMSQNCQKSCNLCWVGLFHAPPARRLPTVIGGKWLCIWPWNRLLLSGVWVERAKQLRETGNKTVQSIKNLCKFIMLGNFCFVSTRCILISFSRLFRPEWTGRRFADDIFKLIS